MAYVEDIASTEITLDAGQTLSGQDDYLVVNTGKADAVVVSIDDGTTGNQPTQYTITHDSHKGGGVDDWMFAAETADSQNRAVRESTSGYEWRIDLENTSATNGQTYRIFVESRVETAN